MKFIELHDETDTFCVKADGIGLIATARIKKRPQISSCIFLNGFGLYCKEAPEEILQKIAEAEQRHERSFMDDWQDRVYKQVGRPAFRKDETKG